MSGHNSYDGVPETLVNETEHRRKLARAVNTVLNGKINCVTSLKLTASATTTTFTDSRIGAFSHIVFTPTTPNAAAVASSLYVTSKGKGTCTVNHTSDANTDKTFDVSILG